MNAATILLAPWRASPAWTRWGSVVFGGVLLVVAGLVAVFMHRGNWAMTVGGVIGFGEFFLGMFLLAPALLLAVDGQQLRVPGLQRAAVAGLATFAVVLVALPAAAIDLAGGHGMAIASLLALALCGGLLTGLLPRMLSAFVGLLPMTFNAMRPQLDLPAPGEPGYLPLAAAAVASMLLLCALCWWRQLRAADPYRQGWTQPMVLQFRRAGRAGGWDGFAGGLPDSAQQIRQQPDWMLPRVDLGPSGPQHPRYSLRVALGGMFVPMTPAGRARQLAMAVLPSVLVIGLLLLQAGHRHGGLGWAMLTQWAGLFAWSGGFIGLLIVLLVVMQLGQRWQKDNAELPLLALLPGLGTPARRRRDLLAASLVPGVGVQLLLLTVLAALAWYVHMGWTAALAVLLAQATGIGVLVAFTLAIVGGRPLPGWGTAALSVACFVVTSIGLSFALLDRGAAHGILLLVAASAWAVLALVLAWLGRRGWRGLERRPHPFLANRG